MFDRPRSAMISRSGLVACAGLIGLWAVAACGSDGGSTATTGSLALEGRPWTLDNSSLPTAPAGVAITAEFDNGRIAGSSGCNSYSGTYRLDGGSLTIEEGIAGTQMACEPTVSAAEAAYLERLPRTARYEVTGSRLDLLNAADEIILSYASARPSLAGTWDAVGYRTPTAVTSPIPGREITVSFGTDSRLTGNSGCNDFAGTYTVNGSGITIAGLSPTTQNDCAPDVAQQQADLFTALTNATRLRVTGDRLSLLLADDTSSVEGVRK